MEHCRLGLLEDLACDRLVLLTLPDAAARIRSVIESPDSNAQDIPAAVATEPAFSAQPLGLANSAYYGSNLVRNRQAAIIRLGMRAIKHIVMLLLMARVFDDSVKQDMRSRLELTWSHSMCLAFMSEALAQETGGCQASETLLAGLVADICALPVLAWAADVPHVANSAELLDALVDNLRPELGRAMLERWAYPPEFLDVISYRDEDHHDCATVLTKTAAAARLLVGSVHAISPTTTAELLQLVTRLFYAAARNTYLDEERIERLFAQAVERHAALVSGEFALRSAPATYA